MARIHHIAPCLWFAGQAEEAAKFYTGIFENSRIGKISYYTEAGKDVHGQQPGSVLTVEFTLAGMPFTALNGGPLFTFTEAVSFQVFCDTQQEIDYFWERLGADGDRAAQQCGWLKDRFGLSWQIVPTALAELLNTGTPSGDRVMTALMGMKKLDIATLERAAAA